MITTRERVLVRVDDAKSMAAIANEIGISREWVRQILRSAGLDAFRHTGKEKRNCPECGKEFVCYASSPKKYCNHVCFTTAISG